MKEKINFKKPITTPILLLVFNRPEKTQKVFSVIKQVKPQKLYIAADAPRVNVPTDNYKCGKVREIVSNVDWDCEAKYLFHDKNLGCSKAGITAWDWLFSYEDRMIFLEDDGVPSKSCFWFWETLLEKYKNNTQIGHISGINYGKKYGNASYFFTRYGGGTYGLATWKRTHDLYEYGLESYYKTKNQQSFKSTFLFPFEYKMQTRKYEKFLKKGGNTYDLQIGYQLYKHNLYGIVPNINMVTNIGFDIEASNTKDPNSEISIKFGNKPRFEIDSITHPEEFKINLSFEKEQLMERLFWGVSKFEIYLMAYAPLIFKMLRKIKKISNRQ